MIESIISDVKILSMETLSSADLDRIITYSAGVNSRICIIHDNAPHKYRDELIQELRGKKDIITLNKVFPDPKADDIMEMVDSIKDKGVNVIIGIGGGSSLDSAKAVSVVLSNGGDLDDYLGAAPARKIEKRNIKLILIPTTAGTGSEVTKFGVYTARSGRKYTLNNPFLQPDIALLIASYTYTLPPHITAATAFDALSHGMETLWNVNATPVSDLVATEAIIKVMNCMETAYKSSLTGSAEGRLEMLEAACASGIAFNLTGTAAVHALSFILSEEWHVPHGIACAFTLEDALEINLCNDDTRQKFVNIAKQIFGDGNEDELLQKFTDRVLELKKMLKLPFTFKDLNIDMKEDRIGELFNKSLDDPKMKNNIIPFDELLVFKVVAAKI